MSRMYRSGFTIVELLIVIVVIAILAAISVVAYNGIQSRAENSKTIAAVSAWAKALQMYKIDNGNYPSQNSCLGASGTYSGVYSGRCWPPESNGTWVVQNGFLSAMNSYMGGSYPEPSSKDVNANVSNEQYRGAIYYRNGGTTGDERIYAMFQGITSSYTNCPDISGLGAAFSGASRANGYSCYYRLPQ